MLVTVGCKGIMAGMYIAEFAHKRSNGSRDLGGNQVKWWWWLACLPACNEVLGSRTRHRVPINDGAVRCKMPPCNASSSNNPRIQEPTLRHVGCLLSQPTRSRHVVIAHWPKHCHTALGTIKMAIAFLINSNFVVFAAVNDYFFSLTKSEFPWRLLAHQI